MKSGLFLFLIFSCLNFTLFAQETASRPKVTLEGRVVDEKTNLPVNAEVDIFYDSDFILDDVQLSHEGHFSEKLGHYGWYIINISAAGYLTRTDTLWVVGDTRTKISRDYLMKPLEVGLSVVLDHVYFYFGQTLLKPDSYPSLNNVAEFFRDNPQITVEIGGHTDDEGPDEYNLMLSEGRAKAVREYFVKQGVDSTRLQAHGYGETRPLDPGITKAAKARNRRVEFVIVSLDAKSFVKEY